MSPELKGPGFQPNFSCDYSVVIPRPLPEVFAVLGTSAGHERVCRLSKLCTKFELLGEEETISLPMEDDYALSKVHVRTLPANSEANAGENASCSLPRQPFTMTETVPLVFGLLKSNVILKGTLTWDSKALPGAAVALYESESNSGIQVWKLRTFEQVDGNTNSTRVSERIEGICPKWLKVIVQREAEKGHVCVYRFVSFVFLDLTNACLVHTWIRIIPCLRLRQVQYHLTVLTEVIAEIPLHSSAILQHHRAPSAQTIPIHVRHNFP